MKELKINILLVVIGIICCIPVVLPYLSSGYFPTHDGEWAVVRASEMFREVRDMQFPPRYSTALNFGYGYPLFNFAYPFPYYVSTFLHVFQFGFIDSIKLIFAGSVLFSFLGMFCLVLYFWKNKYLALTSGLLYVYLPYRLVDLFVRGSIGESIAFCLYPFLLLFMIFASSKKHRLVGITGLSVFIPVLITTHNISAVFFGFIYLSYFVSLGMSKKYKEMLWVSMGSMWGGLISAYFLLPALLEKKYIKLSEIPIADRNLYFVSIPKLLIPTWGYGTPTESNPFTYQIGIPQVLVWIGSLATYKKVRGFERSVFISFFALSLVLIFMMLPQSSFLWKLPLLSEINYPWILLLPLGFVICFLSGALKNIKYGVYFSAAAAIFSIILFVPYAEPSRVTYNPDSYYATNEATTTSSNELTPLWVQELPISRADQKILTKGGLSNMQVKSNSISFLLALHTPENVTVNQIYYPGWEAYVNGHKIPISYRNKQGLMVLKIPAGSNNVQLVFSETPMRIFANSISILAFAVLCCFVLYRIYRLLRKKWKKS